MYDAGSGLSGMAVRRRESIKVLSGAAAWPLIASSQQPATKVPRIGWLVTGAPPSYRFSLGAFRDGLKSLGYVEGRNVSIEYRWAEGNLARPCRSKGRCHPGRGISWRKVGKLRLPAVYGYREYVDDGGMIYGASITDTYRRAAGYVDRILNGANPGDLPIQLPAKFELVVNLKTARMIGFTLPDSFLLRADAVIE